MHFFVHILQILGSISLFIFAIKFLSENLQALAGTNFKRILNQITATNTSSVLAGTVFTAAIQSSSAASVFILGFINAGLINLKKAFGLILGANIGTTLTLLIIYFGLKFDFLQIALPLLFLSFPFYFSHKSNFRKWGAIIIGLALLYISIYFLKQFLPDFNRTSLHQLILDVQHFGFFTKICFIIIGILLTLIVHFSTATITIALLLTQKGLPIELAAMLVLGANIGTTLTAHLVAAIGNKQTKIVAGFHTLFNVSSAVVFLLVGDFIVHLIEHSSSNQSLTLITFDLITNIVMVILVFPFINKIALFSQKFIKENQDLIHKKIDFFSFPFGSNSDIYRFEANKKMIRLAGTARQIVHTLGRMITESDEEKMTIFRERLYQLEKDGDDLEQEVKEFLNEISNLNLPNENSFETHQLITLCNHLESVGDIAIKIASIHRKRRMTNSYFTPKMRDFLINIQTFLEQAITELNQNLNDNNFEISMKEANQIERTINSISKEAENNLYKTIEKEQLSTLSAIYYKELIQHYEQLGDHMHRANQTIVKLNRQ